MLCIFRMLLVIHSIIFLANTKISLALEPPELFKCSSGLVEGQMEIPMSLRAPMSANNTEYWKLVHGENLFRFKFSPEEFQCPNENSTLINLLYENNYTKAAADPNHLYFKNEYYFTPEGSLKTTTGEVWEWVNPKRYCVSEITAEHVLVKICAPSCKNEDICVKKCCTVSQVLEIDYKRGSAAQCKEVHGLEWKPPIYKESRGFRSHFEKTDEGVSSFHFTHRKVPCRPFQVISPSNHVKTADRGRIRILENGKVMTRRTSNHPWREITDTHCVDRVYNVDVSKKYEPSPENMVIGLCEKSEQDITISAIYFTAFIISSVFAFLTVSVYVSLWDKQNIHGWTVVGFSFCMFFYLVTSAFSHGAGLFQAHEIILSGSNSCILIAVLQHFFYVAVFSWLTVLCFDLWSTISSMAPSSARSNNYTRLIGYACFGFGVPTVVVLVAIGIEVTYKDDEDTEVYKPLYAKDACSVDKTSFVYYTTVINIILYGFNLVFAGLVAKTLWEFKQGTKRATSSSSKKSQSQSILYLKLFVIMGITWMFEFISWFAVEDELTWYWAMFDVYNIFQAVGIFWIFVCKTEIKEQLCEKYEFVRNVFRVRTVNAISRTTKDRPSQSTGSSVASSTV